MKNTELQERIIERFGEELAGKATMYRLMYNKQYPSAVNDRWVTTVIEENELRYILSYICFAYGEFIRKTPECKNLGLELSGRIAAEILKEEYNCDYIYVPDTRRHKNLELIFMWSEYSTKQDFEIDEKYPRGYIKNLNDTIRVLLKKEISEWNCNDASEDFRERVERALDVLAKL